MVRHGQEPGAKGVWKSIVAIKDSAEKVRAIDDLVACMKANKEQNGFWADSDGVSVNSHGAHVILDDPDLYYALFDVLQDSPGTDVSSFVGVIHKVITGYFGNKVPSEKLRRDVINDANICLGDFDVASSVKNFKGKSCAMCVEHASASHNLWLLLGMESAYVESCDRSVPHAFCVVKIGENKNLLFDTVLGNYLIFENDPVKIMLDGIPFEVPPAVGVASPGCYANESVMVNDIERY